MNQIVQIANNIKQAYADDAKGITRLHLSMAIALLQELSTDLTKYMLSLESVGEQPREVFNFTHVEH
jgi:hypothetical protein